MNAEAARPALSIVIPAYNEEARLPATLDEVSAYIARQATDAEVIVVDNGSVDRTCAVVKEAMDRYRQVRLLCAARRGKGAAARVGALAATREVVVVADADLSWSVDDLLRLGSLVSCRTPVVIGSREGHGARRIGEPLHRHLMGRAFNRVVQMLAVPGIEDTQCGFKLFHRDAAQAIFTRQRIDGFGFDVEVLFLARALGYPIAEVPLRWEHKPNSRVQPLRDSARMLGDVLAVRLNDVRGRYARQTAGGECLA